MAVTISVYGCTDWPRPRPPGNVGPPGIGFTDVATATRVLATVTQAPPDNREQDSDVTSQTSTIVRSDFPETWIWTEAMTGYVVVLTYLLTYLFHGSYCSNIVHDNLFTW